LKALGWDHFLPQQSAAKHRSDVPDYLLFEDEAALARVKRAKEPDRYKSGVAIVEAKKWERYLDRGREPDLFDDGVPSTQMLRYLSRVEVACGAGHTLPVFFPVHDDDDIDDAVAEYKRFAPALCANMNSIAFDYLARQKVQGNHLTWFILEQLPLLPSKALEHKFRRVRAIEAISREVLHLTYTADDMAPFARDMGHKGPPLLWDEEDRRHRRARLDAIYFHLYGIWKDDAAYILNTFPIVKREDEERFGRYLTKELILAYMNAVAAGDIDTVISV
jgi:hypothetical protein